MLMLNDGNITDELLVVVEGLLGCVSATADYAELTTGELTMYLPDVSEAQFEDMLDILDEQGVEASGSFYEDGYIIMFETYALEELQKYLRLRLLNRFH